MIPKSLEKRINLHEFLMSREQLMKDIESIVDDYFQARITECSDLGEIVDYFDEARDCLVKELCDAVCNNFSIQNNS